MKLEVVGGLGLLKVNIVVFYSPVGFRNAYGNDTFRTLNQKIKNQY